MLTKVIFDPTKRLVLISNPCKNNSSFWISGHMSDELAQLEIIVSMSIGIPVYEGGIKGKVYFNASSNYYDVRWHDMHDNY